MDWTKFNKIFRLLSSSHDGEVLAARNKLNDMLVEAGISWNSLALSTEEPRQRDFTNRTHGR